MCPQLLNKATSPEVLDTLRTIIAPGRRVRVSPFVEAAQFQILFGSQPDPGFRHRSAQEILREHAGEIQTLAKNWVSFLHRGKNFDPGIYDDSFLKSYLASVISG